MPGRDAGDAGIRAIELLRDSDPWTLVDALTWTSFPPAFETSARPLSHPPSDSIQHRVGASTYPHAAVRAGSDAHL